jgi:hypothetical protein
MYSGIFDPRYIFFEYNITHVRWARQCHEFCAISMFIFATIRRKSFAPATSGENHLILKGWYSSFNLHLDTRNRMAKRCWIEIAIICNRLLYVDSSVLSPLLSPSRFVPELWLLIKRPLSHWHEHIRLESLLPLRISTWTRSNENRYDGDCHPSDRHALKEQSLCDVDSWGSVYMQWSTNSLTPIIYTIGF